jgi:hypothetical protein
MISLTWRVGNEAEQEMSWHIPSAIEDIKKEPFLENLSAVSAVLQISFSPRLASLRYEIGTRVECKIGTNLYQWLPGTITQLFYREENWPLEVHAPYQIRLDNNKLIFAPEDSDEVIRLRDRTADLFETLMLKVSDLESKCIELGSAMNSVLGVRESYCTGGRFSNTRGPNRKA